MVVEGAGGKYGVVSLAIMALLGNIPIPFFLFMYGGRVSWLLTDGICHQLKNSCSVSKYGYGFNILIYLICIPFDCYNASHSRHWQTKHLVTQYLLLSFLWSESGLSILKFIG